MFYTKDGKTGGKLKIDVTAWSSALDFSDYKSSETLTTTDYIVRPNGVTIIPEPATMSVLVLGSLAILARRRRRRA